MKMKLAAYPLNFHSGLHIGTREGALEGTDTVIHSDTLYSAFFNGYRLLYGDQKLEQLIALFDSDNPPFLFSSAFPFWGNRHFLPVPKNQISRDKKSKKVAFLENSVFAQLLRGAQLEDLMTMNSVDILPKNLEEANPIEEAVPWKIIDVPRVALDRISNHPGDRYFHCSEVHFNKGSGLYFLVRFINQNYENKVTSVMSVLADEGIGGDRTTGKGLFSYAELEEMIIDAPEKAKGWLNLSMYYPSKEEWKNIPEGYYDFIERRGFIYSQDGRSLRRMPVSMFTEGSVFPSTSDRFGKLLDVTPGAFQSHKVYRSGMALGIPCVLKEGEI